MSNRVSGNLAPWVLTVAAKSNPRKVADAIAATINIHNRAETLTIGAGALNQAVKAIAIARGIMAPRGFDLILRAYFTDLNISEQEKTAIRLVIEPKEQPD